ncbi:MAG TPA: NAD(+)/NADH kinase [Terriglobia bacterium]|nr:NAD(+)/NADH kinase [Terriglobia bacterium]
MTTPKQIQTVGVISKPRQPALAELVPELISWLEARSIRTLLDRETAGSLDPAYRSRLTCPILARAELVARCDLVIVLGGDGTLLAAARHVRPFDIPILAVNLGSLGFLTAVTIGELYESLLQVLKAEHQIDRRKMLQINVVRSGCESIAYHALNDAVLNKGAISRISDFETYIDGRFLNLFKADGLIVSTPTGSTAYCLAAGGPIVHPAVEAFIITPICSHTLTNRPLVVSDQSRVEVVVKTEAESVFLTVDGQVGLALHSGDKVACALSSHCINLVRPASKQFYEVLRSKLKWGER